MIDLGRVFISAALGVLIGGLGYWRRSLTASGWLGAALIGTATAGLGGWVWGALVVVFFVTSSALSHWRRARKARIAADKFDKTERRDVAQTLANGGAAAALAVAWAITPQPWLFATAVGALATVTGDTWATEIGTLSPHPPRLITTLRSITPGTSGGVTLLGLLATAAGSLTIGLAAFAGQALLADQIDVRLIVAALIGGVAGALVDSLLGATVQEMRFCPLDQLETEQRIHRCGTTTVHLRGWRWLSNDWVNFLSSVAGGVIGAFVWLGL